MALDLWQAVTSAEALKVAWFKVKSNGGSAGGDHINLGAYEQDLFANLTQLRADVLAGNFRSGPIRKVSIPKKKPGYRILSIPPIRDRVLHTSIALALTPFFEKMFEDCSFAYRPGRGVVHAVERIEKWHRKGYDVVIEADIVSYFDNIDHAILIDKLKPILNEFLGGAAILELIRGILSEQATLLGTNGIGLLQGSPLSPLLANMFLDELDEEIEAQGVKLVRFADDFVILCKSEKKAEKVLSHCVSVLERHNLRLHEDGTRIVNFDKGFDFIGYLFLRTMALKESSDTKTAKSSKSVKSQVTDEGVIQLEEKGSRFDPGQRVLYVLDPSHFLNVRNRSFSVQREDGSELIAIPHRRVGRIEVGDNVDYTRKVVELALEERVPMSILDGFGQTKGTVVSSLKKAATLHLAQAGAVLDKNVRLQVAAKLVDARIRNQRTQLKRLNRTRKIEQVEVALDQMKRLYRKVEGQGSVEEVRGIEGAASAIYWPALGKTFDRVIIDHPFRRTRPAKTYENAAINYLTAILERDIRAAIQYVSLHPGFGFLHASKDRHDGLVYDLMEPFRAALSEGLVVYLFNSRRIRDEMFSQAQDETVHISSQGRHAIINAYETAVSKKVNKTDGAGKLGWRAMMVFQAQTLAKALREENIDLFMPYLMEA
ncbi:CRISPR-associated endonuclease Cas1 [Terasakiella pusilla]|uniref:CRISPR-associated endonuclease Cas1 n=1 Tax=Terasakiella pusilla TaxID=64973 RepID=UPI003AA8013C